MASKFGHEYPSELRVYADIDMITKWPLNTTVHIFPCVCNMQVGFQVPQRIVTAPQR